MVNGEIFFFKFVASKEIGNFRNALHDTRWKFVICWIDFWFGLLKIDTERFFSIFASKLVVRESDEQRLRKYIISWNPIFNFWFWFWRSQNILLLHLHDLYFRFHVELSLFLKWDSNKILKSRNFIILLRFALHRL